MVYIGYLITRMCNSPLQSPEEVGKMKSLLAFMSVIALGACQHWGQPGLPQDTPEVAAAKAAHLAALARVNSQHQQQPNWNQHSNNWNQPPQQQWSPPQQPWRGPLALPPGFDQNGAPLPVRDTPEVQAEKARHIALYNAGGQLPAQNQWNSNPSWNGPPNGWNNGPHNGWNNGNQWNHQG